MISISLTALYLRETRASVLLLYQLEFCTHSHFFPSSVTLSSLPNLFRSWYLWGLQRGGNLRKQDLGCMVDGKNSQFEVCDCFLCFQTCVWSWVVTLKENFTNILCGKTILKCFCSVSSVWIYRSELMVWLCGIMSTKILCFASWKTVTMTFPAGGVNLTYSEEKLDNAVPLTFCLQFKAMGLCFMPIIHHQPSNGKADQNTPLSTQFCDSLLSFVKPHRHTLLNVLKHR
jgi:hypothetical protein